MSREILQDIIDDFSPDKFTRFFRDKNRLFVPRQESLTYHDDDCFSDSTKLGEVKFVEGERLIVCGFQAKQPLSERSSKKTQYEKGKKILKENQADAGIFIFYDKAGNFRFSLIYPEAMGRRRQWSNFRRFTYFVSNDPGVTNKTFLQRIGQQSFDTSDNIKEAFALGPVTDIFYKDFFVEYSKLVEAVKKKNKPMEQEKARDVVLLLAIRIIFLGFIQKRGWIGNDEKFIQNLLKEYEQKYAGKDLFYERWLKPLFFQALNSPPGRKVAYGDNDFLETTEKNLQMAPYLNGGLFKEKSGYDDQGYLIPDREIKEFFDFLFSYNFTIEENSYEDEDLQLNPEFLGIIFERLVNKADGAVYTPRTEVDLMCRLSLVKWLEKNINLPVSKNNLYELFFREGEKEEDQKHGSFSEREKRAILELLENVTICDPAVGSGAFLVGMIQVIDEIEQRLKERINIKDDTIFERKKRIIAKSLYGVEVKEWAVWICQLRLWLSLFIDAPDAMRNSFEPILPSLDFKVRQGDSLVQRIGSKTFPVLGHANLPAAIKTKVTQLKNFKIEYFQNKIKDDWEVRHRETTIFREILKSEIDELRKQISRIKQTKPEKQMDFLEEKRTEIQLNLDFDKDKVAQIEKKIAELKEELNALRDEKPLIWNIEFAEIFVEKGGFDIVIGNPPYVRQENISDPTEKIKDKKQYKKLLAEMVRLDFPSDFSLKSKINAQSDLYTYFYIRALRLLNPNGIHTFICSNSWLDVGYGVWLQRFLLARAPVEFIIDNHAKRSFEVADVNTIISIIHAPVKKINGDRLVKFVAFKRPFEETVFTEYLLQIDETKKVVSNEIFRVYPISIKDLKDAGSEYENEVQKKMKVGTYVGDKWGGKYLRAPDIFFTIMEKRKGKLTKLRDVAEVRFGLKTGANDFFYLTEEQIKKWGISEKYLKKTIFSFKELKSILQKHIFFRYRLFWCPYNRNDITDKNVLKYIEYGEHRKVIIKQGKDKGKSITGYNKISSCQGRKNWYAFPKDWNAASLIFNSKVGERFFVYLNSYGYFEDKKLYGIIPYDEKTLDNLCLSLNSTITRFFMEILSRELTGAQAILDITVKVVSDLPYFGVDFKSRFNRKELYQREMKSIFEECGIDPKSDIPIEEQEPKPLPDRAELDKLVFDALGLTEEERKEVYRAVCRLVWNRISKAKSV